MVEVNCPLCGENRPEPLFQARDRLGLAKGEFSLVGCASCGMVYVNPRPGEDELAGYYPKTYWGERQAGVRELFRGVEERLKEGYKLRAVRRAGLAGGKILDVGCGRGEFLYLLKTRGFEVTGLEPGAEAAGRGREELGLDIINGTLGGAELPVSAFDAATMWHVLEHLPEPLAALRELYAALKPGGVLLVALPDFGSRQAEIFRERWFGIDAPRHLAHFTRAKLSEMLKRAGFRPVAFYPGGARYETAMLVRSLFPALNEKKLRALGSGSPLKYVYKAAQLALDAALLPAGLLLDGARGSTFTAAARKV